MTQSPEYPQYKWIPPRSYTRGRADPPPLWIVIHTTEGSEGPSSAEDGAAYDQQRKDQVSAHFYVDSSSIVQCVRTADTAHPAAYHGNLYGIHIEVCGRAGQSAKQWDDAASRATLVQLSGLCRTLRRKYPMPLVNLTPAQVRGLNVKGFCEHKDVTLAWGESTHTDPGPNFPWSKLFSLINQGAEDDEMTNGEKWTLHVINYRTEGLKANRATINIPARPDLGPEYKAITETNGLAVALAALSAQLPGAGAGAVDAIA